MFRSNRTSDPQGQVLVLFALLLVALLGFLALAVQGGWAYVERRQMQNASDAASIGTTQTLAQSFIPASGGSFPGTMTDAVAYNVALSLAQANGLPSGNGSLRLEYLDSFGAVVGSHPTANGLVPQTTRGVRVTAVVSQPAYFLKVLNAAPFNPGAKAAAQFGPAGSVSGVTPMLPDGTQIDIGGSNRLQPYGGGCSGGFINVAWLDTATFGSHQDFFDALLNGVHDPVSIGTSYSITNDNNSNTKDFNKLWDKSLRDPLLARIAAGSTRGDSATSFRSDSPQLLIVPTVTSDFGSPTMKVIGFAAFFLTAVDPNGCSATGTWVNASLPLGNIDNNGICRPPVAFL